MKNLTARMENSRVWWQSEVDRRNEKYSRDLVHNLAGLYLITGITMAFLHLLGVNL